MQRKYIFLLCWMIGLLGACRKNSPDTTLAIGSVSIQRVSVADTLVVTMPVAKDTTFVIGIKAMIGLPVAGEHRVNFGVDVAKLTDYQSKYGNALLLPSFAYFFYQPSCRIPAGATLSDSAEINIVEGTKLKALTTYVLPVIIRSVDGSTDGIAKEQTLYVVIKTGKSPFVSKAGWTIASVSSQDSWNPATNLLDNDDVNTLWSTDWSQTMPQNVVIDFNDQLTFSGVAYRTPAPYYPTQGGYPTQIQIELSTDGTNWVDKGLFVGQTSDATQTVNTGICTARYLRFTILSVQPYWGSNVAYMGGIGLVP